MGRLIDLGQQVDSLASVMRLVAEIEPRVDKVNLLLIFLVVYSDNGRQSCITPDDVKCQRKRPWLHQNQSSYPRAIYCMWRS